MTTEELCSALEDSLAHAVAATRALARAQLEGTSRSRSVVLAAQTSAAWEAFDLLRTELRTRLRML